MLGFALVCGGRMWNILVLSEKVSVEKHLPSKATSFEKIIFSCPKLTSRAKNKKI